MDVYWHGAGCQNGKPGLALKIMAPTNSPAPDSADKPARSNLKTNLHAFGVSGVAFIVTLIGILHYWDRLIWPLMSPLVLAWLAWTFLEMVLRSPSKIAPDHALKAMRFERRAKQSLFLFWCCWQWGLLFYVGNSSFRYTRKITGNGSLFDAAITEFVTASALMYPIFWYALGLLFAMFAFFLVARQLAIAQGKQRFAGGPSYDATGNESGVRVLTTQADKWHPESVPASPVGQAGVMAAFALFVPLLVGSITALVAAGSTDFFKALLSLIIPGLAGSLLTWLTVFYVANTMKKRGRDPRKVAGLSWAIAFVFGFASFVVGAMK